jgi:adenylosuccinate synthase
VGWLDLVALKYAVMVNGVDELFLTKLDVLDEFEEIKVVTHYEYQGEKNQIFDFSFDYLNNVKVITRSFPGWKCAIGETRLFKDLPAQAREYVKYIEDYIKIPVKTISLGMERDQTVQR